MKTVRLITCDSSFQARLILGALENEGIAGILHNENSSNILKGYINNIGVDIFVYEDEYEKALKVLEQNEIIAKQMKYCPYCHSDNIEYALKKEKKIPKLKNHQNEKGYKSPGRGICILFVCVIQISCWPIIRQVPVLKLWITGQDKMSVFHHIWFLPGA